MGIEFSFDLLRAACASGRQGAPGFVEIHEAWDPLGGVVMPPSYPGQAVLPRRRYVEDRLVGGVRVDGESSQANRCEEACLRLLQEGILDDRCPVHRFEITYTDGQILSMLDLPHRHTDGYLFATEIEQDGTWMPFPDSTIGTALLSASMEDASALVRWCLPSLAFGSWDSYGRGHAQGRGARFARAWKSEMVGLGSGDVEPDDAAGGRMDPWNLSLPESYDLDLSAFQRTPGKRAQRARKAAPKGRPSQIGLGNIPISRNGPGHGGVPLENVARTGRLSFPTLRRLRFGPGSDAERDTAGRAVIAAFALLTERAAFGEDALSLRSGCDLVKVSSSIRLRGGTHDGEDLTLDLDSAVELYAASVTAAAEVGLTVEDGVTALRPNEAHAKVYEDSKSLPVDGDSAT